MKKNIEWLKEEMGNLPCVDTVFNSYGSSYIDSAVPVMAVYDLLDQLDEAETLSPEWIGKYAYNIEEYWEVADMMDKPQYAVSVENLQNLLVPKHPTVEVQKLISKYSTDTMSTYDVKVERERFVKDLQKLIVPEQEEITHKQVEKYLLDKNIRVIDIDIYEEMQSELEELKNSATLSKTETVADVIADFYKSLERLKEVLRTEVEELEE